MDEEELLAEVVTEFKNKRDSVVNGTQDREYLLRHLERSFVQVYPNKSLADEVVDGMLSTRPDKVPQPLENFELRLYHNNKIATLLIKENKKHVIWFKSEENKSISRQPYYIFKHKETGAWHMW